MTCNNCESGWFWKKIGRCQRCMNQLSVLCVLFWVSWLLWGIQHTKSVEGIALIGFGLAVHLLLSLHLWMKFIVLPLRNRKPH
ncbi:DUF3624 domain-containing protein [Vibrio rhizosphaerae]|uniref:DUF3624 domain-containing protein n=1 Tax=Vibrio rhizosphaerae TaxID=398736 RepID=A0ABU4ITY8_9VIBR|nr:DUF3624 domain-containing protein [Vibrio rhizosphaerae]MDW6091653.1 DUF3624 domain-containing protein [Vibrio rhizosphaerae]